MPNRRVFWITSRTPEEFRRAYIKLGNLLAIPGMRDTGKDLLGLVKSHLSEEIQGSWLMVLDGANNLDSKDLKLMMDYIPSSPVGAILATMCNRSLAKKLASKSEDLLHVKAFEDDDTFPLLRRELTKERISDDEISELSLVLGGLPIAIVQASAYLTAYPEVTGQEYLQKLNSFKPKMIDSGQLATTQISFDHINKSDRFASCLACIVSAFEFQTIPTFILRFYEDQVEDFCTLMTRLALICVTADRQEVSMSQLVRSSIKDISVEKEPLSDAMSERFPPVNSEDIVFPQVCEILLPYAEAALRLEQNPTTNDGKKCRAKLLFQTARYTAHLKKYEHAIQALKEAVQLRENENPQDSKLVNETKTVLKAVEQLAKSSKRASTNSKKAAPTNIDDCLERAQKSIDPKQQTNVVQELLKYYQALQVEGKEDNIDAKKAEDALAILYDNQGHHDKAVEKHENVLKWCVQEYGEKDLNTYRQVYKIARSLELRKKYKEAEVKYREAWEGTKNCLGEDHPEAARILCNLATVYSKQGRRSDAQDAFKEALSLQERRPGSYADTLMTKHNYAVFIQGNNTEASLKEAGDLLRGVLHGQEAVLGSDHPDTLRTAGNLAGNLSARGEDKQALTMCRLVFPRQVETLGLDHYNTVATKKLMARIEGLA